MAKRIYPFLPVEWLSRFRYETGEYVKTVTSPVLVAHSPDDEIIPYAEGLQVFESVSENGWFFEMRGGHNDGYRLSGKAYTEALRSFINENLDKPGNVEGVSDG